MATGDVERAAAAVRDGDLVVYPTETVYGLGADALDSDAVERVFAAKGRDRDEPISMAVDGVEAAATYARPTERERKFMRAFLPGPVTVVLERTAAVPDVLTAGRDRVGVRVPDHAGALELLARTPPLTATSANVSGRPSVRRAADLDEAIRDAAAVVLRAEEETDDATAESGSEPGSTVVDVSEGRIHRRGAMADAVEAWLAEE